MASERRQLRICLWAVEDRLVDATRIALESGLGWLGEVTLEAVSGPDDPALAPCDLLTILAPSAGVPFEPWLAGTAQRIRREGAAAVPALIVASLTEADWSALFAPALAANWYFDIMPPEHFDSLPLRVANLLRIHDHLHELQRYERELRELSARVTELSQRVGPPSEGER